MGAFFMSQLTIWAWFLVEIELMHRKRIEIRKILRTNGRFRAVMVVKFNFKLLMII